MKNNYRSYFIITFILVIFTVFSTNVYASKGAASDDDSVNSWGPWGKMVSPAAGPPAINAINVASFYTPQEYKPDVKTVEVSSTLLVVGAPPVLPVVEVEFSCSSGSVCGYGGLKKFYSNREGSNYSRTGYASPIAHQVSFFVTPEADTTSADWHLNNMVVPSDSVLSSSSNSLSFRGVVDGVTFSNYLKHLNGTLYTDWKSSPEPNVLFSMTGKDLQNGLATQFSPQSMNDIVPATVAGTGTFPGYLLNESNLFPITLKDYYRYNLPDTEITLNSYREGRMEISYDSPVIIENFKRDIGVHIVKSYSFDATQWNIQGVLDYIKSNQEFAWSSNVVGTPTTIAQLEAANVAGNVKATYNGFSLDISGTVQAPVSLHVDFGAGTWDGSWNGGLDGKVVAYNIVNPSNIINNSFEETGTLIDGAVGFNAAGIINGNTIAATNIYALDGVVYGSIDGAFFNSNGDVLAGVSDIVKTRSDLKYENGHSVSTFVTVQNVAAP